MMGVAPLKIFAVGVIVCILCCMTVAQADKMERRKDYSSDSQSIDVRLHIGKWIQSEAQIKKELQSCEETLAVTPANYKVLMKSAYLHFRMGWLYTGGSEKKKHYFKFFDLITRAKLLNPEDYDALLLMAVAKAKIVEYLPKGDQVRIARELVQDVQVLMNRDSDNIDVIYLSSWLNYEVGKLSSMENFFAAILFGGLPESLSVDKAFFLLKKIIQKRPDYIVYRYDLGLYYLNTQHVKNAREQFEEALAMPPVSVEGSIYHARAKDKIEKISRSL